MAKAMDVANFFIDVASKNENGDYMTNLRLQKLLYFAQAWHLTRFHIPLFPESIMAWRLGPIVRTVYDKFKEYGRNPIKDINGEYDPDAFSDDELSILLDVLSYYDRYATDSLVGMTHKTEPWNRHCAHSEIIPQVELDEYFSKQDRPFQTLDEALEALQIDKGRAGKDGRLIFQ